MMNLLISAQLDYPASDALTERDFDAIISLLYLIARFL